MTDPRGIGHVGYWGPTRTAIAVRTVDERQPKEVGQVEDDGVERIGGERVRASRRRKVRLIGRRR